MPVAQQHYETIAEAAERLGVHPNTVRRHIAAGHLEAHRLGPRLIRLDPRQVDALLRRIPSAA